MNYLVADLLGMGLGSCLDPTYGLFTFLAYQLLKRPLPGVPSWILIVVACALSAAAVHVLWWVLLKPATYRPDASMMLAGRFLGALIQAGAFMGIRRLYRRMSRRRASDAVPPVSG